MKSRPAATIVVAIMNMHAARTAATAWILLPVLTAVQPVVANEPLLERDVLPILTRHCMGCHGGLKREAGLDLRTLPAMLAGGESGPAVETGRADRSELWRRVSLDEMPAGDRAGLSPADKRLIRDWINAGLPTVFQRDAQIDPLLPAGRRHPPEQVAQAIDQQVDRFLGKTGLEPAPISDDAEFLRRVYLDLTGCVPSAGQVTDFLDDGDAQKRSRLIDQLLAAPAFGNQFGRTWRDWVCPPELPSNGNAGTQPHQQARDFGRWLGSRFTAGHSWDSITREILTVSGETKDNPQVIFFALVGQGAKTTPDGSARAAASLFMGVQLQCARCHDDPYRDWSQEEHWALSAFFGRSQGDFEKIEVGKGPSAEAGQIVIPDSAFRNAGTRVSAAFPGGTPHEAADGAGDMREPFVDWLVAADNPYFARAFANRLWFYLFSRGIVNPIDDLRQLNPPSHPGLLKLLAGEFTASGYDIKHLLRCLCNSQTYQRTSRLEPGTSDEVRTALTHAFGRMPIRVMTADMLYDSLRLAYGDVTLDLRTRVPHSTVGMAAPVADPYLEFQRRFGTREEDATEFTHGVAQILTMLNHRRLLAGSRALDALFFPDLLHLAPVESGRNEDFFPVVRARFVRFTVERGRDQPCLDELEVYGPGRSVNLAHAGWGAVASASSLLPDYEIHQVAHLNDGRYGNAHSWISNEVGGGWAQIRLPAPAEVDCVVWSRDREGKFKDRVARHYRIEVSLDGRTWTRVSGSSRRPASGEPSGDLIGAELAPDRMRQAIEWLFLSTLSRRPSEDEFDEAMRYAGQTADERTALSGILWTLVNRSEYMLVR